MSLPSSIGPTLLPLLAPLLASLVLAGCTDGSAPGDGPDGQALQPTLQELYRVGSVDGTGWEAFAQLRSLAFDAHGRLYILDSGQHQVVVLDSDGTFLRTIGSRGEGPEELRSPFTMTVLGTGEVAIYDMGHQSFLVFSADGEFRRSVRAGFEEGMPGARIWPHGASGVVSVSQNIVMMSRGGGRPSRPTTAPIRRFDLSGGDETEVLHEAWIPTRDSPTGGVEVGLGGGGGVRIQGGGMRAFEPQVHLATLPDGHLVVADTSSYRLRLLDPEGAEVGVVEHPVSPTPVGEAERRAERERRLTELQEGAGPQISMAGGGGAAMPIDQESVREMFQGQIETMDFWHEIPVIRRIAADAGGRIWLGRSGGVGRPGPIDILSGEGELLGTLEADWGPLPDAFGPDGRAAWIETDEFDVPYVRVRRIEGLPQG